MLPPDSRVVLLEQLSPPPEFSFEAAVATTFTLDLTATLVPALAFTSYSYAGAAADPIALLEAIRATGDRLDVFCQGGNIAVPSHVPDLLAFLEPLVHEVRQPPRGGLFHPKVWFVKYVDEVGVATYRLLVLTRNLTNDRSWDLAVRLDSEVVMGRPRRENAPLGDFLASLPGRAIHPLADERAARVAQLADEARRVQWTAPDTVEDVAFHYLDGQSRMPALPAGRKLVVSPFLNAEGLRMLAGGDTVTVLSRGAELERLSPEIATRHDTYVIDSMAVVTETDGTSLGGDLHAKMYVVEPSSQRSKARIIIGSANATDAAFQRNVEFMVEMRGHRRDLGIDRFLGDDAPFRVLVEPYAAEGGATADPKEDEQHRVENALRAIAEIQHTVAVVDSDRRDPASAGHTVRVTAAKAYPLESDWAANVEP